MVLSKSQKALTNGGVLGLLCLGAAFSLKSQPVQAKVVGQYKQVLITDEDAVALIDKLAEILEVRSFNAFFTCDPALLNDGKCAYLEFENLAEDADTNLVRRLMIEKSNKISYTENSEPIITGLSMATGILGRTEIFEGQVRCSWEKKICTLTKAKGI